MRRFVSLLFCWIAGAWAQSPAGASPEKVYSDCLNSMNAISPKGNHVEYCTQISDRLRVSGSDVKFPAAITLSPEALAEIRRFGKGTRSSAPATRGPVNSSAAAAIPAAAIPAAQPDPPVRSLELDTLREVRAGWSRDQVLAKLGPPAQKSSIAGEEVIEKFYYRTAGGGRWLVRLVNGNVVASENQ